MSKIKIVLTRSVIGSIPKHRKTIEALGLKKINSFAIKNDDPAIQGMVNQVKHLVKVEKID